MKLVAIGMVKDEVDIIERTLRHVAEQGADAILLLENDSSDGTAETARELAAGDLAGTLTVWHDGEPGYYQSRKMTNLANLARERHGATWVWPFDADELWTLPGGTVRDACHGSRIIAAELYDHRCTPHDDGAEPFERMAWRELAPIPLPKVIVPALRGVVIEPGNHGASGAQQPQAPSGIVVHHYPYRSPQQFVSKARNGAAAYARTDLPAMYGAHWRAYGDVLNDPERGVPALRDWFYEHFYVAQPEAGAYVCDPWPAFPASA